jgi:threonine 3-dehydrogenase
VRALYKGAAEPGLTLTDRPEPEPGLRDVKIRVARTGICGTDLHIESWDAWAASVLEPPLIPGHEFSGEVVEIGSEVTTIGVGDVVSGEGHVVCGVCRNCRAGRRHLCINTNSVGVNRDGAFADYVVIPESNVWRHPEGMDLDLASIFDPLGNAVHTTLQFPLVGEDVLITGAGPIGCMAAAVARHVGARFIVVTDVNDVRLQLAAKMGADLTVNVSRERIHSAQQRLGMKEGFDIGLEMSGSPAALTEMLENLTHGARVALLGLPSQPITLDWSKVVSHMITIKGIYGREMYETWYAMNAMVSTGLDISPVITDRFPASQWEDAFAVARKGNHGKVLIDWS